MFVELLSDNAIENEDEDAFGFEFFVDILGDAIKETRSLPFTVGVFGEWGTGKTSLLNLLRRRLERQGSKTVWFNPWKYDQKEELWTALIQSILVKIHRDPKKELKTGAWTLLKNIAWFAVKRGLSTATGGVLSPDRVEKFKNDVAVVSLDEHKFLNDFEKKFSDIVDKYVGPGGRLIVFIDDLDRCIPENAITVLESLKLYLDKSNCVFVLGMDRTIVELGIKHRYGESIKLSGREYLDKIIQLPFFLPPVLFRDLQKALRSYGKVIDYTPQIWHLLRYGLGGNPRKAKRFVNSFYMAQQALKRPEISDRLGSLAVSYDSMFPETVPERDQLFYLAKVLVIQMSHPDFYDYLLVNPKGWWRYEEIVGASTEEVRHERDGRAFWRSPQVGLLRQYQDLSDYWEKRDLRAFMMRTGGEGFPAPPSPPTLERILRLTSIVERTDKTSKKKGAKLTVKKR
jgi:hypothetical protein